MLLLTEVTSYEDSFEGWNTALLVAEERRLFLRGGNRGWKLGEDGEVIVGEVVNYDVAWRIFGSGEEGKLIGQCVLPPTRWRTGILYQRVFSDLPHPFSSASPIS